MMEVDSPPSRERSPRREDRFFDISEEQDGGLLKKILKQGAGDKLPPRGSLVSVHYVGRLIPDGSEFDSCRLGEKPFTFEVGEGQMIRAWEVGVMTMKRGEKALLRCAPHYAYGEDGALPKIPKNAHLDFEVELLDWKVKPKEPEEMTHEERSAHALRCKDIGNAAFKKEDWTYAIYAYEQGVRYMQWAPGKDGEFEPGYNHGGEEMVESDTKVAVALLGNCAAAWLKAGDEDRALQYCSQTLAFDPVNVKALLRKAQAHLSLGNHPAVREAAAAVLVQEPLNTEAKKLQRAAEAGERKGRLQERELFAKMLG